MSIGVLVNGFQYWILKTMFPAPPAGGDGGDLYCGQLKLKTLFGDSFFESIAGKVVIDFGCGVGLEAIEMARMGAARVIGLDIREDVLQIARQSAVAAGVDKICQFTTSTTERADVVVSVDAFEHFTYPAEILRAMSALLAPAGQVIVSFGPTWYHPLGGHLFSVFPWAHLLFQEQALIRWRSDFKTDGAKRFSDVAGGLNQITIRKFEQLVGDSPLQFAALECVPIKKLRRVHNRLTREFTTAIVRCRLIKRH